MVISGAYYLEGDSIQFQLDVSDAVEGTLLGSVDPVRGARDTPSAVLEQLQQMVMGFLAVRVDDRLAAPANLAGKPPSFEAYQAYSQGLDEYLLQGGGAGGQQYFRRAFELDSTWVEALLFLVKTHRNVAELAEADSLLQLIGRQRAAITPYYRAYLEYHRGVVDGDHERALEAIRRAAQMAPSSRATYNLALQCNAVNRPQEAIDALLNLDPERGSMRGWDGYYWELIRAYAALDEHGELAEVARRGRTIFRNSIDFTGAEGIALTGLGRVEEVNVLLDDLAAMTEQGLSQGVWMINIAVYERRKGYVDAARTTIDRAISWLEDRLPETRSTDNWRRLYAWALYVAARFDEAYNIAKSLSEEFPEDFADRGLVGLLAAWRGNEEEAQQVSQWLGALQRPYLTGFNTIWRAMIAGALGEGENAVALGRQAFAEGFQHPNPWTWAWIAFEPIRDYPPFQELIRPKG
jgi:hypothetical protein